MISEDRRKQVADISKAAKSADAVFLATDLDREGEAIAWHVAEAANIRPDRTRRVTFSEITEPAIREAFANPRDIDQNLVDAQQTRRIVDRLVGYTLSPLIGKKVQRGLSAGRVQSVAVRLVVEREREINAFTAREYWTIQAILVDRGRRDLPGRTRPHRRRSARHPGRGGLRCARRGDPRAAPGRHQARDAHPEAIARRAVHDVHAPAGSEPSARLQPEADDVGRPATLRRRRDARGSRRPHHLHANRLHGHRRRGDGRGPRRHRRALRRAVHDAEGPGLQDEVEGRPGGPRVGPARPASGATRTRWPPSSSRTRRACTG